MPSRRFDPNKEQSIAQVSGSANPNRGNGNDIHAPIGRGSYDTDYLFRLLTRFAHDWSGMTQVTKIEFKFKMSAEQHTAQGSSRRVQLTKLGASFDSGGGSENSWAYGISGEMWSGPIGSGATVDFSLTSYSNGDWVTLDITSLYDDYIPSSVLNPAGSPGAGAANNGLRIWSYDEASVNRSFEFWGKDSSYPYYIVVTYLTNQAPAKPVLTSPVSVSLPPGSTPSCAWTGSDPDAGDVLTWYDLVFSSAPGGAGNVWQVATKVSATAYRTGWNMAGVPPSGASPDGPIPSGQTVYWRVRNYDAAGAVSPWSDDGTFVIGATPTVTAPHPSTELADIWNLNDLAVWDNTARWAKPILTFVYGHAGGRPMGNYRLRIYNAAAAVQYDSGTVARAATPGTTVTLNAPYAVINGTAMKWGVEAQDADGNWSAAMALVDFKVRWGQGVYSQNVLAGAQNLKAVANVSGTGARSAIMWQSSGDAAGTVTPTAWVLDVNGLAPTLAYVRGLVRLAATVSGQNPLMSDLTLTYAAAASLPDKWTATAGGTCLLDPSIRRFGYYSAKMTGAVAGTAFYIHPWRRVAGDGVAVTQDTDYVFSMYVKTNGALGTGQVQLMVRAGSASGVPYTPYANPVGTALLTSDSSAAPDGWQRLMMAFHVPTGVTTVWPTVWFKPGVNGQSVWVDGGKFEEGRVASLWTPGFLGEAITLDALGVTIDAKQGGVLRLRGSNAGVRDIVELGTTGLLLGGDTTINAPSAGVLAVNGVPLAAATAAADVQVLTASGNYTWPAWAKELTIEVVGGGAKGGDASATGAGEGASGGGGGGGGYARRTVATSGLPNPIAFTIGAGGTSGTPAGGATSFGTGAYLTAASGGTAGSTGANSSGSTATNGGTGGVGTSGQVLAAGDDGGPGRLVTSISIPLGYGGGTALGGITGSGVRAGNPGSAYGGGGAGAVSNASTALRAGGNGAPGVVIVTAR